MYTDENDTTIIIIVYSGRDFQTMCGTYRRVTGVDGELPDYIESMALLASNLTGQDMGASYCNSILELTSTSPVSAKISCQASNSSGNPESDSKRFIVLGKKRKRIMYVHACLLIEIIGAGR